MFLSEHDRVQPAFERRDKLALERAAEARADEAGASADSEAADAAIDAADSGSDDEPNGSEQANCGPKGRLLVSLPISKLRLKREETKKRKNYL